MTQFFSLQMITPGVLEWLTILVVIFATIISIRFALKRIALEQKQRRLVVVVFNIILALSILGLLLKPKIESDEKQVIRLITTDSLETVSKSDSPGYWLIETDITADQIKQAQLKQITIVSDPEQILIKHSNIDHLEVIGDGLNEKQWRAFSHITIDYQAPSLKAGIYDIRWDKKVNMGEYFHLKARVRGDSQKVLTARLLDPAGDLADEKQIRAGELINLMAQPKLAGVHRYIIEVKDGLNIIASESINLLVTDFSKAAILVIQSAPSFETKHLQNWAAEHGAQMMVKTQISRDKFITRKTNLDSLHKSALSPTLLQAFDMLIIDGRAFLNFKPNEIEWLYQATRSGLGLLIVADQALVKAKNKKLEWLSEFELATLNEAPEVTPYWFNNSDGFVAPVERMIPTIAARFSRGNQSQNKPQVLVQTASGYPLVLKSRLGNGRIAMSLIRETHRWVTNGDSNSHSHYWQNLIHHIGRTSNNQINLDNGDDNLLFENQLAKVCLLSSEKIEQLMIGRLNEYQTNHRLLMQNSTAEPSRYCGYFWPRTPGWFQVVIQSNQSNQSNTSNQHENRFYIEPATAWTSVQQQNKIRSTINKQTASKDFVANESPSKYSLISPWIFWWLFLISASVLWLERKFE